MTDAAITGSGSGAGRPVPRDRDTAGRPRNSRARDALGRPLPRGVPGVVGVPEDITLTPDESLAEAQRLLDAGRAFAAHEVLEAAWKAAPDAERECWRGLAQLAVGVTHTQRGNAVGAVQLLRRAADRIEHYADDPPHAVDARGLAPWARALARRLDDEPGYAPEPTDLTPRLRP